MGTFGKVIVYMAFVSIGTVVGLILTGWFIDYQISFNGIPASKLTAQQITEMMSRNPAAMKEHTSVIVDGKRLFTVDGAWLTWLVVLSGIIVFGIAANRLIAWGNKNAAPRAST